MPKFSIIIPVYNLADKAPRIVTQIAQQQYKDIEVIVVDDGSTDNTLETMREVSRQHQNIRVLSQENAGPSAARNYGLAEARGSFVLFCDGDDEIHGNKLASLLTLYQNMTNDLVVLGWEIVRKHQDHILSRRILLQQSQLLRNREDILLRTLRSLSADGRLYNLWNKIYRLDVIRRHNLTIPENLRFGEDLLFNLSYLAVVRSVEFSDAEPYYVYEEDSPTSIVSSTKLQYVYRTANTIGLQQFASLLIPVHADAARDLVRFVQWRWLVSYALAVCQSSKGAIEKYRLIRQAIMVEDLRPSHASPILSSKKIIIEYILFVLTKLPPIFFFGTSLAYTLKKWRRSRSRVVITLPKI